VLPPFQLRDINATHVSANEQRLCSLSLSICVQCI
jgi:hypothetical protein